MWPGDRSGSPSVIPSQLSDSTEGRAGQSKECGLCSVTSLGMDRGIDGSMDGGLPLTSHASTEDPH